MTDWTSAGSGPREAIPLMANNSLIWVKPRSPRPSAIASPTDNPGASCRTFSLISPETPNRSNSARMYSPLGPDGKDDGPNSQQARLRSSAVVTTGRGESAFDATPMDDLARSVRSTALPCATNASTRAAGITTTSTASPVVARYDIGPFRPTRPRRDAQLPSQTPAPVPCKLGGPR